jgi:prolyl 4-hydroxylase
MESFIREYQLSDASICDSLVALFKKGLDANMAREGTIGADSTVDHRFKKSTDFSLLLAEKLGKPGDFRIDAYQRELFGLVDRYLDETKILEHGGTFTVKDPPQIQWYKPGEGFYAWHIDAAHRQCERALVFTTYLNDVSDGGGTEFYHQQHTILPRKGKTAIFPAGLTHVHRGVVSALEHKYLLTGWLHWS